MMPGLSIMPGFFGAEPIILNGDFGSTSDWTLAAASISGGVLNVTNGTNFASQAGRLVAGASYSFSLQWTTGAGHSGGALRVGSATGVKTNTAALAASSSGTFTGTFTAADAAFVVQAHGSVFTGTIDNIIVTRL